MALPDPVALSEARTENRVASSRTYYGASMAVLFVFFAAQFGVVSLLAERRNGTLARMLASPIPPWSILAGKLLVSIVLAVVSMSIIVAGTTLLLGARWGDPLAVAALVVSVSLAASGIALLVVGLVRTEDQASGLMAIIAMTLAVLGGSFFQMSQAPEGLATRRRGHPALVVHQGDQRPGVGRGDRARGPVARGPARDRRGHRGPRPLAGPKGGGGAMTAMTIAWYNLVRLLRDRMGLFFIFLLPIVLIVVLGTAFGGRVAPRLGVVSAGSGALGQELVEAIGAGDMRLEIKALPDRRTAA